MSDEIKLGETAVYISEYSPDLLNPLKRSSARNTYLPDKSLPFTGFDVWTGYELSWLDQRGKPQVAIAQFVFSAESDAIIESKSFKYYLNSFNQTKFDSASQVIETLKADLTATSGSGVTVELFNIDFYRNADALPGTCIDSLPIAIDQYQPEKSLLSLGTDKVSDEMIFSHLLKTNCPVTGQPDWATIWIKYSGMEINPESLLKYFISYRECKDFHETCVEKIFCDLLQQCQTQKLTVYARYTRRGGLDINPFRTDCGDELPDIRVNRQ